MKLYAVIPTVGERDDTLIPMIDRLTSDGVNVIVIHNTRDDADWGGIDLSGVAQFVYYQHFAWKSDEPVNLSKIWNIGLDYARELAKGEDYVVAVFNDDLTLPSGIVQRLAAMIQQTEAAAAFVDYVPGDGFQFFDHTTPWHLGNRMCGYAFALRSNAELRADEDFLWWWGDSDLDLRARRSGGVVAVQVPGLTHHDPNGYTNRDPALYEQAGRDRETFQRKHGFLPW